MDEFTDDERAALRRFRDGIDPLCDCGADGCPTWLEAMEALLAPMIAAREAAAEKRGRVAALRQAVRDYELAYGHVDTYPWLVARANAEEARQ